MSPNSRLRPLVLASRSPQRRAILEQLGVGFRVVVPDVEELASGPPEALAVENARRKATAVARAEPQALVLGVDTIVWAGGKAYGKPADAAEARAMLSTLSGMVHTVMSGVCLAGAEGIRTGCARTSVRFRELDEPLLGWYVDTGEWRERAGGYAIQGRGAALVEAIDGDYLNVVGLPVATLLALEPGLVGGL